MAAPDYTDKFNTSLSADDEKKFEDWRASLPKRLQDMRDYDLRGAFKADASEAANGHLPDTFKKPNHPTFSDESQYSTPSTAGGHWSGDDKAGWSFTPSKANLSNMSADELQGYFKKVEPDSKLNLPQNAADKRYGTPTPQ